MKVGVVSVFMANLPARLAAAQYDVVSRFLPAPTEHYSVSWKQVLSRTTHAQALDEYVRDTDFDLYVVLDADAIPLTTRALTHLIERARQGVLVGNVQRSNHIQNDRHVYVAPSAMAFSRTTFVGLGSPSFAETPRGDVGEEFTYLAEARGVPIELLTPLEVFAEKRWALGGSDEPRYGNGTVFGDRHGPLFYHQFEIRSPAQQEPFIAACQMVGQGRAVGPEIFSTGATLNDTWPKRFVVGRAGYLSALSAALQEGVSDALLVPERAVRRLPVHDGQAWQRLWRDVPSHYGVVRVHLPNLFSAVREWFSDHARVQPYQPTRQPQSAYLVQRGALSALHERLASSAQVPTQRAFEALLLSLVAQDARFSGPFEGRLRARSQGQRVTKDDPSTARRAVEQPS